MKWFNTVPRWIAWGLILPLIVLNGWLLLLVIEYFRQLLTIFITANLLAFLLNYAVLWLQQRRVSRSLAIALVFLMAMSGFLIVGVTLIPILIEQINGLFDRLPDWIASSNQQIAALQQWAIARRIPVDLLRLVTILQENLAAQLQPLSTQVFGIGIGLAGIVVDLTIIIALTFYLLIHGDHLWDGILQWLPGEMGYRLRQSVRQNFHNYFSGQATLAALMGMAMIVAFLAVGVPFGLLFGLGVGVMTLIPFGAPVSVCFVSFLMSLTSIWLGLKVLVVGIAVDQSIENGIAPRLLGRFTGLNPAWVLVALLVGVRVGGVLGLLLAVPIAGFLKSVLDALRAETPSPKSDKAA